MINKASAMEFWADEDKFGPCPVRCDGENVEASELAGCLCQRARTSAAMRARSTAAPRRRPNGLSNRGSIKGMLAPRVQMQP